MTARPVRPRLIALGVGLSVSLLSACSGVQISNDDAPKSSGDGGGGAAQVAKTSDAKITSNLRRGAGNVDLERKVRLNVAQGTFSNVSVTGPGGAVIRGRMSPDRTHWVSTGRLQAASAYHIVSSAVDSSKLRTSYEAAFRTRKLSLDEQTYPSFVPVQGQTVGVAMPVIIRFDVAVTDKASIERHLRVISRPAQVGSFHWISDNEVHWRPRNYWKPGTHVTVDANIGGVPAGKGIYGQKDRSTSFTVGRSMVSTVDINSDQMHVYRNGALARTIPITTGQQPKFTTRSGTKVIVEKFRHKRMNSETIGIDPNSADGYDLDDVEYAMRITYSGEFLHAAPWSVGSQGHSNVSHGCTGMSTANAAWLYDNSIVGDPVRYTGSSKYMTLTNGFGDWNESFADYKSGSALS